MALKCESVRAVITRALFVLVSLVGVFRVTWVKNDRNYWFLTFLFLPLVTEMIISLKWRKGKDYKWFSPPIFLFLISIIPSMWILELHHQKNKTNGLECSNLDSFENIQKVWTFNGTSTNGTSKIERYLKNIDHVLKNVCSNVWILALHQILLILLIVGKWLLPQNKKVNGDELPQLLLSFVSTAADILEFTNETLSDIKENSPQLVYVILGVWTWTTVQFPFHMAGMLHDVFAAYEAVTAVWEHLNKRCEESDSKEKNEKKSLLNIWCILVALFIQDGPFLVVRLTVMFHFKTIHQMLLFFAIKNALVVILNLHWWFVMHKRSKCCRPAENDDAP